MRLVKYRIVVNGQVWFPFHVHQNNHECYSVAIRICESLDSEGLLYCALVVTSLLDTARSLKTSVA